MHVDGIGSSMSLYEFISSYMAITMIDYIFEI